jgi:hypothetical protein
MDFALRPAADIPVLWLINQKADTRSNVSAAPQPPALHSPDARD